MSWFASLIDHLRLYYLYWKTVRRLPNFRAPRYLTEKIQVAKLKWRSPRMVLLADKVEAKKVVAELLGAEWVTPTLYAGAGLPPREERNWPIPFVIKANHSCGANYFVRKPEDLDWDLIESKVDGWMRAEYGKGRAEWVYRAIKPQVLVEPFIGGAESPEDFKLHVYGGRFEYLSLLWDRRTKLKRAVFDRGWNKLPFVMSNGGPYQGDDIPRRPDSLEEMVRGAEVLAKGFPFVRVDFYEIDGKPRFGEVTFYPHSGLFRMMEQYDRKYGALWPEGIPD